METRMRIAVGQFTEVTHERLTFAKQLGVAGVQLHSPVIPGEQRWEVADLRWLRERCEGYGLRLEAIENTPFHFYDKAMLGLPGRDEQIEHYQATLRNLGAAGIPILGYHWMPNGVWRTSFQTKGRGDALVASFDLATSQDAAQPLAAGMKEPPQHDGRTITEDEMWRNYRYFMEAVVPVAEEAGVKLALHPDDPPLPMLGGIGRLFYNFDGFRRAMELVPSPNSGLDFCVGCWSEMGPGVVDAIRYLGPRGKIFYVHFRDVQGTATSFQECFLGEGNQDVVAVMRALKESGFTGFIIDDHVPHMLDDTVTWGHRGRSHATGYLQGLLEAVEKLC
jgi:mannonate dehydratase